MSIRETRISGSLQQWRGVDQRTSPPLVREGFFTMAKGVQFGFGDNAERMPGKRLAVKMDDAIVNIVQFGELAILQTLNSGMWTVPLAELTLFDIVPQPGMPEQVSFDNVESFELDVILPNAYPPFTLSFSLERSLDLVSWTTVDTGLAPLQVVHDDGLTDDTTYYYRAVAIGISATFTNGAVNDVTTPAQLPLAPLSPDYDDITTTSFDVYVPALATYADDMDLQRSPDNATWGTTDTGLVGGEIIPFAGETTGVVIYFRMIAHNVHGTTNGPSSSVIPDSPGADARITEDGDIRITEDSDFRVPE